MSVARSRDRAIPHVHGHWKQISEHNHPIPLWICNNRHPKQEGALVAIPSHGTPTLPFTRMSKRIPNTLKR